MNILIRDSSDSPPPPFLDLPELVASYTVVFILPSFFKDNMIDHRGDHFIIIFYIDILIELYDIKKKPKKKS